MHHKHAIQSTFLDNLENKGKLQGKTPLLSDLNAI